jgi:hypothetical protein
VLAAQALEPLGLHLHPDKTRIVGLRNGEQDGLRVLHRRRDWSVPASRSPILCDHPHMPPARSTRFERTPGPAPGIRRRSSTTRRALISDAEVAETTYTAFTSRRRQAVTARLIVRRVRRLVPEVAAGQTELTAALAVSRGVHRQPVPHD